LQVEPDDVVGKGEEDAEDKGAEGPLLDLIGVVEHKDAGSADGQIEEICAEEEDADGQKGLNADYKLGKGEPGDVGEAELYGYVG
jgi:hypothetical protein